jgi:hypothetical protein
MRDNWQFSRFKRAFAQKLPLSIKGKSLKEPRILAFGPPPSDER